ncbi:hypothetical protein [Thermorudis peleae]|uniref:hypothetical protein n=1 Tax=Thermorudis peleae TaxID=1382356 RepID=UPI0005703690|nr:hypothetical protein [Thermorudis peleae]MBX6755218.1 hypothetical protein [Thermorudis peleae]
MKTLLQRIHLSRNGAHAVLELTDSPQGVQRAWSGDQRLAALGEDALTRRLADLAQGNPTPARTEMPLAVLMSSALLFAAFATDVFLADLAPHGVAVDNPDDPLLHPPPGAIVL